MASHKAKVIQQWLEEPNDKSKLALRPNPTDFNPVEHLRDEQDDQDQYMESLPKNLLDLMDAYHCTPSGE